MKKKRRYEGRPIDEPAGYKRADALARVKDELAEVQETEDDGIEGLSASTMSLENIELDGEIVCKFSSLPVSKSNPNYVYTWARFVKPYGGLSQVDYLKSMTIHLSGGGVYPCWEVVQTPMKEARELTHVDGTRVIGDVLLMRCRRDVYALIQQHEAEGRRVRERGPGEKLQTLGDKYGIKTRVQDVAVPTAGLDDPRMKKALNHAAAHGIAAKQFDRQLRDGTVRGMEVGG